MPSLPRLAVTLGDPRGIGPEIVAAALRDPRVRRHRAAAWSSARRGTGVAVDDAVGDWAGSGSVAAQAGRLAGLAVDRAIELAQAGEVARHRHRAARQARAARRRLRLSRAHRAARRAHRLCRRHDAGRDTPVRRARRIRCASCSPRRTSRCATCRALTRGAIADAGEVTRAGLARLVRHRRAAHRALRAQSACRRRRPLRHARTTTCSRPPRARRLARPLSRRHGVRARHARRVRRRHRAVSRRRHDGHQGRRRSARR